jgi:hypothetical protein
MLSFLPDARTVLRRQVARLRPRAAAVTIVAMLAGFGAGLVLAHLVHLRLDTVVLAVAIGLTLGRTQQTASRRERVLGLVLVPAVAAGSGALGLLLAGGHALLGSALFVLALSATVGVRRWGPLATKLGTMAVLPLLVLLLVPPSAVEPDGPMWTAATALLVYLVVSAVQLLALRAGVLSPPAATRSAPRPKAATKLPASTRMAAQLGVALVVAIALGRLVFPAHWQWVVLTAFIVCSGNRGRADVLHKGILRVAGAGVGTVLATGLFGLFGPGGIGGVLAIFGMLGIGVLLREASYAYWACCVTATMALLLGYLGEDAPGLLFVRLGGILLGGLIGVGASWLVLPIKGGAVTRDRDTNAARPTDDTEAGRRVVSVVALDREGSH